MNYKQDKIKNRFILAIPLFVICIILTQVNFDILWRYFAWSNQTLATIFLWIGSVYLLRNKKNYWITIIPATFMTYIVVSYILQAEEGFRMEVSLSNGIAIVAAIVTFLLFMIKAHKYKNELHEEIAEVVNK